MINYDELKTTLTVISNICRVSVCTECPMCIGDVCVLYTFTPDTWLWHITTRDIEQFAARGAHLVEEGYIDE